MPRRFAARRGVSDANHPEIAKALRQCGASVVDLHAVGGGCPDLLVGYRGVTFLLEVKTEKGMLRDSQDAFMETWRGRPVLVVRSIPDALHAIGMDLRI